MRNLALMWVLVGAVGLAVGWHTAAIQSDVTHQIQ